MIKILFIVAIFRFLLCFHLQASSILYPFSFVGLPIVSQWYYSLLCMPSFLWVSSYQENVYKYLYICGNVYKGSLEGLFSNTGFIFSADLFSMLANCICDLLHACWQVILDKYRPKVKTVINKREITIHSCQSKLEVLAGNHSVATVIIEGGIRFHMNLATVYFSFP